MNEFFDDDIEGLHDDGVYGDEEDYGSCPVCGSPGEMLNAGKDHWMVCHDHKVKWHIGVGFFSSLQREDTETWDQAGALLATYREVKPLGADPATPAADSEEERFRRLLEDL